MQLQLFHTNKTGINCSVCGNDPGFKPTSENHWNGFFDMDMQKRACFTCSAVHYAQKSKTEFAHMYSEFPVLVNLPQKYHQNKSLTHA
jgi:hypothetical protein